MVRKRAIKITYPELWKSKTNKQEEEKTQFFFPYEKQKEIF